MAEHSYFLLGGWGHGGGGLTTSSRLSSQRRPITPTAKSTPNMKSLTKSTSTPALPRNVSPGPSNFLSHRDSGVLNTIPDPRTPSPNRGVSRGSDVSSAPTQHPDLTDEVATLSTKLVNAINHQTNLDDNLQATRHELETARARIMQLEIAAEEHARQMRLMVRKDEYTKMEKQLRKELDEERKQRFTADKEKKRIESELETLTTALFEEANTMVAAARKDKEASDRRGEQLKTQLHDAELLLSSHQEQLQDLKAVLAQMSSERDEEINTNITAPSTPALTPFDKHRAFDQASLTPNTPGIEEVQPAHPLHFTHLISPVLRADIEAYNEFHELLKTAKTASAPGSRASSGNYGGLNVMGLGPLANLSGASLHQIPTGSTTSIPASSMTSPKDPYAMLPPLKDIKFYKRALTEDIEPTLRLDNAPGLSWLARRTVLNSMTAGTLTIEPHPPILPKYRGSLNPCSMCGENRQTPVSAPEKEKDADLYARKHRFRTSDAEDAQRYPLCDFCLARVRSCCDYIGFLRMCRDGHWRAETGDEEKSAWEESVRLRERMFWARIGGGVVPAIVAAQHSQATKESPAQESESKKAELRKSVESELKLGEEDKELPLPPTSETTDFAHQNDGAGDKPAGAEPEDPLCSQGQDMEKSLSLDDTVTTRIDDEKIELETDPEQKLDSAVALDSDDERRIEKQAAEQLQDEMTRRSLEVREHQLDSEAQLFDDGDEKMIESKSELEAEQAQDGATVDTAESSEISKRDHKPSTMPGGFE